MHSGTPAEQTNLEQGEPASRSGANRHNRGAHPLWDEREAAPDAALPRLNYKHLGMHIGGESNSVESKRPWFEDIERYEEDLLACYKWVKEPMKGGSYGVDLYVSTKGGQPEVRGSRQKLGDEKFDDCMRRAFSAIEFHRPERPTVFSYSIFFELEE